MAGSRLVEVKRAVIDGLAALPALASVAVTYAYRPGQDERDRIFAGRSRATHRPASLKAGRTFRDEVMAFDLVVLCELVGGDAEESEDRAVNTLGLIVEEFIADNRTLGVTGVTALTISGLEVNTMFNDRGHLTEAVYQITYNARLT